MCEPDKHAIKASLAIRRSESYFLLHGARNLAEANSLARAELFAKSVGWCSGRKTRHEKARHYLDLMRVVGA